MAGLALFALGSAQTITAQGSHLGIPKSSPQKKKQGHLPGGDIVIPKAPDKKGQEEKPNGPLPQQKAQAFEIPKNMPGLKAFVTALTTEENIGREELVAMYELVSKDGKSQLMLLTRKMDAASVAKLSRVYAAIGEKRVLPLFLARLRRAKFGKHTETIVESVVLLAEARGIDVALEMLGSRNRAVRMAALQSIRARLSILDLADLLPLLDSKTKPARAAAVEVLVEYLQRYPEKDIQPLVDCLGHKDGRVRNEAAKGLMSMMERAQTPLLAILKTRREKTEWYLAALILGVQELVVDKTLLPPDVTKVVVNLPSTANPMQRGVSSIILGLDLFREPEAGKNAVAASGLDPKEIVTALIDTIGQKSWYPEYPIIHNASKGVTALLTGKAFGSDSIRWRAWWGQARRNFVPYVSSVSLDGPAVATARMIYKVDGVVDAVVLGPKAKDYQGGRRHKSIRLTAAGFRKLYGRMRARGFLDMEARYDARKGYAIDHSLTIEAGGRRAFDGFHGADNPRLQRLSSAFDQVRVQESWQQYMPPELQGTAREEWWARHAKALEGRTSKERQAYVLDLCCAVLDRLGDDVRGKALTWMRDLARDHEDLFGATEVEALESLDKKAKVPAKQVEVALEILATAGDDEVFGRVVGILIERKDIELSLVLPRLLGMGNPERLLSIATHEDGDVRGVAAREIAKLKYQKAYPALIKMLADEDTYVRATAAQSCGLLKLAAARPGLLGLTKDRVSTVQQSALLALAQIGGKGVYRALASAMSSPHKGVRIAAIRGLAALSDPQAASMLLDIAEAHYPEDLSLYALFGLSRRGGGELRAEVRLRLRQRVPQGLRKEFLYLLGEMQDPEAGVVDFLLAEFKRGRTSSRCCRILAGISGRDWCNQADRASKYAEWFQAHRDENQGEWFLSALREQGFKTTLTRRDLVVGAKLPVYEELARILTEAPEWQLRALAAHFLRDLTGQDYGNVMPDTRQGALDALAQRYRAFARSKSAVGGR